MSWSLSKGPVLQPHVAAAGTSSSSSNSLFWGRVAPLPPCQARLRDRSAWGQCPCPGRLEECPEEEGWGERRACREWEPPQSLGSILLHSPTLPLPISLGWGALDSCPWGPPEERVRLSSFPAPPSRLPCLSRWRLRHRLGGEERQASANVRRVGSFLDSGLGGRGRERTELEGGLLCPHPIHISDAVPCNFPRNARAASVTDRSRECIWQANVHQKKAVTGTERDITWWQERLWGAVPSGPTAESPMKLLMLPMESRPHVSLANLVIPFNFSEEPRPLSKLNLCIF